MLSISLFLPAPATSAKPRAKKEEILTISTKKRYRKSLKKKRKENQGRKKNTR
jgi:hypothetical protein